MKLAKSLHYVYEKIDRGANTPKTRQDALIALIQTIADEFESSPTKAYAFFEDNSIAVLQFDVNGRLYGLDAYSAYEFGSEEEDY